MADGGGNGKSGGMVGGIIAPIDPKVLSESKLLRGLIQPTPNQVAPSPGKSKSDDRRGKDAFVGLSFWVEIDGLEVATFDECSAITMETETYEYSEGGLNTHTHKLPVRTKYANITLKRGMDPGEDLFKWYCDTLDWYAEGAKGPHKRKNVTITVYDPTRKPVMKYHLMNAYPVKWTGPELKASAGAIAVESLEFAHEGLVTRSNR